MPELIINVKLLVKFSYFSVHSSPIFVLIQIKLLKEIDVFVFLFYTLFYENTFAFNVSLYPCLSICFPLAKYAFYTPCTHREFILCKIQFQHYLNKTHLLPNACQTIERHSQRFGYGIDLNRFHIWYLLFCLFLH